MGVFLAFLLGLSLILAPWAWIILLLLALPWWAAGWMANQIQHLNNQRGTSTCSRGN